MPAHEAATEVMKTAEASDPKIHFVLLTTYDGSGKTIQSASCSDDSLAAMLSVLPKHVLLRAFLSK